MNPANQTIDRIVILSARLGEIVSEEINTLKQRRPSDLAPLVEMKSELSDRYQAEMNSLRENPELMRAADPSEVERLKDATFLLHGILDEYRTAVTAAKTVSERLVKAIGDEVAARRRPVNCYGSDATVAKANPTGAQAMASIAVNQVI